MKRRPWDFGPGGPGGDPDREVREEIRFYLEMRERELIAQGMSAEEARAEARRVFGDVKAIERRTRRADRRWGSGAWRWMMGGWVQDLRFSLRMVVRKPVFALTVILTFALGIGAAATMFSVVDATLLRPLPFADAERLVFLRGYVRTPDGVRIRGAAFAEYRDWERSSPSFEDVAMVDFSSLNLTGAGEAARVPAETVPGGYFEMLGVSPLRGRVFGASDDVTPGGAPVAVIGEGLWERRFGRAEDVVGRTVRLNDVPFTIIGVLPESFRGVGFNARIWVPSMMLWSLGADGGPDDRANRWLTVVARLAPGVGVEEAQADLDAVAGALEEQYPASQRDRGVRVTPARDLYLGDTGTLVLVLLGAVGLLLLIACANVANLLLFRASERGTEVLMRMALGAGRRRLVRQFLTESVVLAALGAVLGLVLAIWGVRVLGALMPPGVLPSYAEPGVDAGVFGFAVVLTGLTGLLAGLAPALMTSGVEVATGLKSGARSVASGAGRRLRQTLVVAEVALALMLLVGAVLMMRSLGAQLGVDPGFDAEGVLAFRLELPESDYPRSALAPFVAELEQRLSAVPGVESVAMGSSLPLRDRASARVLRLPADPDNDIRYYIHQVTPGYFRTLGIPIVQGRALRPADGDSDANSVVVSRAFADRFFDGDAVGETLLLGADVSGTIVGVAGDARYRDLTSSIAAGDDDPDLFVSYGAAPDRTFDVALRAGTDPASLVGPVRRLVAELDPDLPVFDLAPIRDELRIETAQGRFASTLLGAFSGLALLLAIVGIYGVMAFTVGRRSREIAIRMAVGARAGTVQRMVVARSLTLTALGLGLGVVGALVLSRFIERFLFQVAPTDFPTYAGIAALMAAVAAAAAYLPARRATRVDPQRVLNVE